MFSFERVIAPISPDTFFSKSWEKHPLVIFRSDPDYYRELLTFNDVDRILTGSLLRYPMLRMVKQGSAVAVSEYTHSLQFGRGLNCQDVITADKVIASYRDGSTIIFQGLHRLLPTLSLFCRDLERVFSHGVQTNIYLTPAGSQGFAPHYDTHDVFVLQITGSKQWKIYGAPVYLPTRDQPHDKNEPTPSEIDREFTLHQGDMVYIPRGFVHEAATSTDESLHITVGITAYTWAALATEAMNDITATDMRFRESLPVGFAIGNSDMAEIGSRVKQMMHEYVDGLDGEQVVERLADKFVQTRAPILTDHLIDVGQADRVGTSDRFVLRDHMLYRMKSGDERVTLIFHGKQVRFPAFAEQTLRQVSNGSAFSAQDLPQEIDEGGRMVVIRRLLREGFITRVK